jgi:hypothetical protein
MVFLCVIFPAPLPYVLTDAGRSAALSRGVGMRFYFWFRLVRAGCQEESFFKRAIGFNSKGFLLNDSSGGFIAH